MFDGTLKYWTRFWLQSTWTNLPQCYSLPTPASASPVLGLKACAPTPNCILVSMPTAWLDTHWGHDVTCLFVFFRSLVHCQCVVHRRFLLRLTELICDKIFWISSGRSFLERAGSEDTSWKKRVSLLNFGCGDSREEVKKQQNKMTKLIQTPCLETPTPWF